MSGCLETTFGTDQNGMIILYKHRRPDCLLLLLEFVRSRRPNSSPAHIHHNLHVGTYSEGISIGYRPFSSRDSVFLRRKQAYCRFSVVLDFDLLREAEQVN